MLQSKSFIFIATIIIKKGLFDLELKIFKREIILRIPTNNEIIGNISFRYLVGNIPEHDTYQGGYNVQIEVGGEIQEMK